MTKKPSLYVVERRELVILVILFVLVTILAFTMGVKYGQNLGRKESQDAQHQAAQALDASSAAGGKLGEAGSSASEHTAKADEHGEAPKTDAEHGVAAGHDAKPAEKGEHGKVAEKSEKKDEHAAKADAEEEHGAAPATTAVATPARTVVVDKNTSKETDEYLLNALKEAGIERRRPEAGTAGKTESAEKKGAAEEDEEAGLPENVKAAPKGAVVSSSYFTIQVGSHVTEAEAKRHVKELQSEHLSPVILPNVDSDGAKRYRVALGKYPDKNRAESAAKGFKAKGQIDSYFVRKVR